MIHMFYGENNSSISNVPYAHTIEDVKRRTTVSTVLGAIRRHLLYWCEHVQHDATTVCSDQLQRLVSILKSTSLLTLAYQLPDGTISVLDFDTFTTVEDIDLFNRRHELFITNLPKSSLASSRTR